ncbi:MAG TPA: hypothetical protein ENN41_05640 [Sediminispirochaeta sp.]|nr:hypothetical protein [Sediminispirochaeta sp.]
MVFPPDLQFQPSVGEIEGQEHDHEAQQREQHYPLGAGVELESVLPHQARPLVGDAMEKSR